MDTVDTANSVAHGEAVSGSTEISVAMPADLTRLPLVRSIAAALAVALDFDIDAIADLRMAVDELVSTVATRARHGQQIVTTLVAEGDSVLVDCAAVVTDSDPVDEQSFGWMVLATLADAVDTSVTATDGGDSRLRIALTMSSNRGVQ